MNLPRFGLSHRAIVLAVTLVVLVTGLFNLATMPRREDPEIVIRWATVITDWPGATAARVADLVTDPLEAAISEMPEVARITSRSIVGQSIILVLLEDEITDADQVWDDMRAKVQRARARLPDDAGRPVVNSDFGDVYEILFAIYQVPVAGRTSIERPYSARELEVYAEQIEDELELIDEVARVDIWGRQPERIFVEIDSADWAKLDLTASQLRRVFESRNILIPGGQFDTATSRYTIKPTGEFSSADQIADLVIERRDGVLPVRLGDLPFQISRRYEEPPKASVRYTDPDHEHASSLVIAISMKSGRNVVGMSYHVDRVLSQIAKTRLPPDLRLTRVNDLPRQVDTRVTGFQLNLLFGAMIILVLALLTIGWRGALVTTAAVPISMLTAIAVVRPMGIELEQFAIASLIISLGLVVDNAIVISDNTLRLMREGMSRLDASIAGAQSLAVPLLAATATTIFAFLPMATIAGEVGDYIGSLPVVVTVTLIASYASAMLVTPILCWWLLRVPEATGGASGRKAAQEGIADRVGAGYERVVLWALERKAVVVGLAVAIFAGSLALIPMIGNQFFPNAKRDQFMVQVWLPEGSPIEATSTLARRLEQDLLALGSAGDAEIEPRLSSIISFIGTGGPRFMLTQLPEFDYPYYALLLVNTTSPDVTPSYARAAREKFTASYPEARISVREFVLGPPVRDPVSFRLSGPDHQTLRDTARRMVQIFKQNEGTVGANSNWGSVVYQADIEIDADAATLAGVTNEDVAEATRSLLSGLTLSEFREGDHRVPIVLRTVREKRQGLGDLSSIYVSGRDGKVPLESIARITPTWQASTIVRRNRIPTVSVGSEVREGLLANSVAQQLKPELEKLVSDLPAGYRLVQGGEFEETLKSSRHVSVAVFISLILIVLTLIAQYNQITRPAIILISVPFALTGVLIGLLVTGWAMGFMAMLGVLALIGIVINNAIILIDFIEERRAGGLELRAAVAEAGRLRLRPILLTTVTTIGGLLPLSLFGGPLWAPMTNGMIFGLIFSTALTLILVPVIYTFFAERLRMTHRVEKPA